MMPVLTDQQRQALHEANDAGPITVVDPASDRQYVLMRADVFDGLKESAHDAKPQDAYPLIDCIMAGDDALDPTLASYKRT
jgi:hypothetical protein